MSQTVPENINTLIEKRQQLRKEKKFAEADVVRAEIESLGYKIIDSPQGIHVEALQQIPKKSSKKSDHLEIALFGSGEISPTGRRVHEYLIRNLSAPVSVALLETPAGFEVNPLHWYKRVEDMMLVGLQNFQPQVTIVEALRQDGKKSTNNLEILKPLSDAQYIHTGAGSPSYAVKHLKNSLAYEKLYEAAKRNTPLSFASAAAVACSKYSLPVYEIYKAGEDIYWIDGLDFFSYWNLNLTIIPHFNNTEGGKEIDTSKCYMGEERFTKLVSLLPIETTILGIDEQTACIFNMDTESISVMGNGSVTVIKKQKQTTFNHGMSFSFKELQ